MYRRLESKPKKMECKDTNSEAECKCACGKETTSGEDKKPAANFTTNQLSEHFIING